MKLSFDTFTLFANTFFKKFKNTKAIRAVPNKGIYKIHINHQNKMVTMAFPSGSSCGKMCSIIGLGRY